MQKLEETGGNILGPEAYSTWFKITFYGPVYTVLWDGDELLKVVDKFVGLKAPGKI